MPSLHTPSDLSVTFDDDHAVANAGFALVGVLSETLGLEQLTEEMVVLAPFPGRRAATLVHAMMAGLRAVTTLTRCAVGPRCSRTKSWQPRRWARSDRKSTRLNSSHLGTSYAVFCLT